jgi:hypothetical protein
MRLLLPLVWFAAGVVASRLALGARVRLAEDKAFVKGWAGALRYQDERNPEVR